MAGELPTGTVTFLFTDLESSTPLWEQDSGAMQAALARHDEVLRAAAESHGGHVVKTAGDGVHAVFALASDAVAAAVDAQRGLGSEPCGELGALRMRMGLHSGAAEQREGDYFGSVVNRAARVMALGHGGQVLCSQDTADLVRDSPPDAVGLFELWSHALRGISRPERGPPLRLQVNKFAKTLRALRFGRRTERPSRLRGRERVVLHGLVNRLPSVSAHMVALRDDDVTGRFNRHRPVQSVGHTVALLRRQCARGGTVRHY